MTVHCSAVVLRALVAVVAREVGHALLTLADTLDPPVESPRVRDQELYVPEAWQVTW